MMGDFPILGTEFSKFCSVHPTLPAEITFTKFDKEHRAQNTQHEDLHYVMFPTLFHPLSIPSSNSH